MTETKDLVIQRVLDAPIEKVWKAWSDPEAIMLWWGPKDFTSPLCRVDFREGGTYLFCMRAPKEYGGQDSFSTGTFVKIAPMKLIEYTDSFADKDGNAVSPTTYGMSADYPEKVRTTVEFKDMGDKTEITLTQYSVPVDKMREFAEIGWNQSLDKLQASLK